MRSRILVSFLFISFFTFTQKSKLGVRINFSIFPNKEALFNHVVNNYSKSNTASFDFEKRKNGVFILFKGTFSGKFVSREKLWDYETNTYHNLKFLDTGNFYQDEFFDKIKSTVLQRENYFNFYEFYGYEEANFEAIEYYESFSLESLTNKELELFSRAKWTASQCFTGETDYNACSKDCPKDNLNRFKYINSYCLKRFIKLSNESLKIREYLFSKDSEYQTFWHGKIRNYVASGYIEMFQDLLSYGKEKLAFDYLSKGFYDDSTLSEATKVLKSLPKDAVLITKSENDTYPYIYLKFHKKIRQDISILNTTLLNSYWYCDLFSPLKNIELDSIPPVLFFSQIEENQINITEAISKAIYYNKDLKTLKKTNRIAFDNSSIEISAEKPYIVKSEIILLLLIDQSFQCYFTYNYDHMDINLEKVEFELYKFKR